MTDYRFMPQLESIYRGEPLWDEFEVGARVDLRHPAAGSFLGWLAALDDVVEAAFDLDCPACGRPDPGTNFCTQCGFQKRTVR